MTASSNALVIAIIVLCLSFGIEITNQINLDYESKMGTPLIHGVNVTTYLNASDIPFLATTEQGFNDSTNELSTFNKPNDINFDFSFFQTIKFVGVLADALFYSTFGFPYYLYLNFNLPIWFVVPMTALLSLNYLLLIMKWLLKMDI